MLKKILITFLAVLFICAAAMGSLVASKSAIDFLIEADAGAKATDWAKLVRTNTDSFDKLANGASATAAQREQIRRATSYGNVYGVAIFDRRGRLSFQSIRENPQPKWLLGPMGPIQQSEISEVLNTGETVIRRHRNLLGSGQQSVQIQVFKPLRNENGKLVAILDIYVDETSAVVFLTDKINMISFCVAFLLLLTFAIPYLALLHKRRQANLARKKAEYLTHFDKTTGLMNRDNMMIKLNDQQKSGEINAPLIATMLVETDGCKKVNETYGHKAGDAFLEHVGRAILSELKDHGLACRYNGDDFVVTSEQFIIEKAADLAERIRIRCSAPFVFEDKSISSTVSIGIHYDRNSGKMGFDQRLIKANIALKNAKLEGRDRHVFYTLELEELVKRRRHIESALDNAMLERRLELHFQPLINARSMKIGGYEALLRLKDQNGEQIPPLEFIPVAEEMGKITNIGLWVIEKAVCAAKSWPRDITVSVNLSPCQFKDLELVENIQDILLRAAFHPSRLEIEVTESLLLDNTEQVLDQLTSLREAGISLALDDFGTGYSSLSYLWKFGFNKLKIDKSFIDGWESDPERVRDILDTIIILGHRLDMSVTAEGIEHQAQADMLLSLGCDSFQGYLFGRPAPVNELNNNIMRPTFGAPLPVRLVSSN